MLATLSDGIDLVLPQQVVAEALSHLDSPRGALLQEFLDGSSYRELPMPKEGIVRQNRDLVRSEKDIPIAIALLDGEVDIFVTNDRDFTDLGATTERFRRRVRVMLNAVFLRDVLGWSSEQREAIRARTWSEIAKVNLTDV